MKVEDNTQPRSSTESKRRFGLRSPALRAMLVTCLIILAGVLGAGAALASVPGDSAATTPKPGVPACDPNWTVVPSANQGTEANELKGVAAVSANDVWAVGDFYSSGVSRTLVEHWNGTAWTVVPSPDQGTGANNYLRGVAAVSANDVWAVGFYDSGGVFQTLVEHWNGTAWTVVPSPNPGSGDKLLAGVTAVSASDVWAVGLSTGSTLTEHWDGTAWAVVPSPNPGGTTNILYRLEVVAASDAWAVGYYQNGTGPYQTLIEHWNGTAWEPVSSPNPGTGANVLYGMAAVSTTDVWAVGYYQNGTGPYQTLIEHWNGTAWEPVSSPNPGTSPTLWAVEVVSANDVWAVGDAAFTAQGTLVERYNPCPPPSPTSTATNTPTNTPLPTQTPSGPTATPVPTNTPLPSIPSPTVCPIQFSDVPQGSTFYPFVRCLACRGIINGYGDGTFRPNNNVTRGQLSKIVSNSAGFNEPVTGQMFQDVPPGSTFYVYIGRLASRGYISGYPCGMLAAEPCVPPANLPYFRTNNNATRGQISKIVSNAAGFSEPHTEQTFQDVSPGSTFYDFIERLASRGVMSGYPCSLLPTEPCIPPDNRPYFRPTNNATRGQTSKIVANTFFPDCGTPRR